MKTRRLICALLALLLPTLPVLAESESFDYDFSAEGGYTGEWLEIEALGVELCLPDGWTVAEPGEGEAFAAASEDGSAAMAIRVVAEDVEDFADWAGENLTDVQAVSEDESVLYAQAGDDIAVYRFYDGLVAAFEFHRAGEDSLPMAFALEIAQSANAVWADEFGLYGESESADAAAGE